MTIYIHFRRESMGESANQSPIKLNQVKSISDGLERYSIRVVLVHSDEVGEFQNVHHVSCYPNQ